MKRKFFVLIAAFLVLLMSFGLSSALAARTTTSAVTYLTKEQVQIMIADTIKQMVPSIVEQILTEKGITNVSDAHISDLIDQRLAGLGLVGELTPALSIQVGANASEYSAGDTIYYSYLVTNTGEVNLYGVSVVDSTNIVSPASMAAINKGESTTFTAKHIVTQAECDAGSITNVAYATDGNGSVMSATGGVTVLAKYIGPINPYAGYINVTQYGVKGDGTTNDTSAIQAVIDATALKGGGTIYFPDGVYLIGFSSGTGIDLKSNVNLFLEDNAILLAQASYGGTHKVIRASDVSNINITGGKIYGQTATQSYQGWAMLFYGCNNITVKDIFIKEMSADGIYFAGSGSQNWCANVLVDGCTVTDCNRAGINIVSVKGIEVKNCTTTIIGPDVPCSGINVEPNNSGEWCQGVVIHDCYTANNSDYGISITWGYFYYYSVPSDITIYNITDLNSVNGAVRPSWDDAPDWSDVENEYHIFNIDTGTIVNL